MKQKTCKVQTFIADVSSLLQENNYRKIYEMVPDFRKEKADRLRTQADKAQSVGAWRLWMMVQEYLGIEPDERNFNLSHSGNYVLCSVAAEDEKVGCDIETIKNFREPLARRFFCPEEYAYIMEQDEEERRETFYRYWVLKESFMKATRQGMAMGLDSFSIRLDEEKDPVLVRQPDDVKETYYMKEYVTEDGAARIAVCATCPVFEKSVTNMLF